MRVTKAAKVGYAVIGYLEFRFDLFVRNLRSTEFPWASTFVPVAPLENELEPTLWVS